MKIQYTSAYPATGRCCYVITRSLCTSQQRRRYVSNETPYDVSVVRHQDISVVCIHDVPLVSLYDDSCKSQMKHPITLLWYVSITSQNYVDATPFLYYGLYYVFKLLS